MGSFEFGTKWIVLLLGAAGVIWLVIYVRLLVLRRQLIALLGGVRGWKRGKEGLEMSREQQLVRCAHVIAAAHDERLRAQKVAEAKRLLGMLG